MRENREAQERGERAFELFRRLYRYGGVDGFRAGNGGAQDNHIYGAEGGQNGGKEEV